MPTSKAERVEARVTSDQKRLLQRAADLAGRSLTDFVITSAQDAAVRTIQDYTVIMLSRRDQETLVHALLHPPKPNKALRTAWKRYRGQGAR